MFKCKTKFTIEMQKQLNNTKRHSDEESDECLFCAKKGMEHYVF